MAEKAQEKKGGDLPRGWKKTTVGEFCPFLYGKGLHKKLRDPSGQIPVFGSNGIVSTHSSPYVHEPGVIIGRKGSIGSVAFSKKPFWPIDTTFYITADSHRDLRYTFYLLKSMGLEHMNSDSAVPGLNRNAAHSREIVIPPLSEQRRIADILGSLDDKIELNRRISETLEAISQAIFKSWFIDFDPVIDNTLAAGNKIPEALQARAKARQAMGDKRRPLPPSIRSLFPAEFDLTSQGPIPKGWKITTVGEVSTCFDNRRIPLSKRQRQQKQPGNIPYYGATSIMDYVNEWIFDDIYLLVGEDGSVMREDGSPFVQYIWGKSWVNNHAHVLQGNLSVSTEHLMLFMKNQNVAAYITGAVQQKINQMNMNGIPFLLANTELNFAFSERIRPLYEKYRYLTELNVNLSKFRNVLLPKILSNRGITSPNMGEVGV